MGGVVDSESVGRLTQRAENVERLFLVVGLQGGQQTPQLPPADVVDLFDCCTAGRRCTDDYDAPVVIVAQAFDKPALRHAVDDARQVGQRRTQQVGQLTHRLGATGLEQEQDVEVSRADRAQTTVPGYGTSLERDERLQLIEDLLDDRVGRRRLSDCFVYG